MNFEEYMGQVGKLSQVKRSILKRLWEEGEPDFPRSWVRSSELLELTGQKYFDRRIRELRDETGCDIETGKQGNDSLYRLLSPNIGGGNQRAYLSATQKRQLFDSQNYQCQVCSKQLDRLGGGRLAPQADHKVPLIRRAPLILLSLSSSQEVVHEVFPPHEVSRGAS